MSEKLKDLIGKQYLLASYIEQRLQIVNYIIDGYNENLPILRSNQFLHYTAHVFFRSIINDLYALFGDNKNNKVNFWTLRASTEDGILEDHALDDIELLLHSLAGEIDTFRLLRNTEIAHYDFDNRDSIPFSFDQLPAANRLFEAAKSIINTMGIAYIDEEQRTTYEFDTDYHMREVLERLLSAANHGQPLI